MAKEEFDMFKHSFNEVIAWALQSTEDYKRKESQNNGKQS